MLEILLIKNVLERKSCNPIFHSNLNIDPYLISVKILNFQSYSQATSVSTLSGRFPKKIKAQEEHYRALKPSVYTESQVRLSSFT